MAVIFPILLLGILYGSTAEGSMAASATTSAVAALTTALATTRLSVSNTSADRVSQRAADHVPERNFSGADPATTQRAPLLAETATATPVVDAATAPLRVVVEQRDSLAGFGWAKEFGPVIAALVGLLGTGAGALVAFKALNTNSTQRANENELQAIQAKLDGFYGPYWQLSETNRQFIEELRKTQPEGKESRTLTALLDPARRDRFSNNDWSLIDQIIRLDTALDELITAKSGLVNSSIQPYLARASQHFRLIRLAYAKALTGEPDRFTGHVYPRHLDEVLKLEMRRLSDRSALLRRQPTTRHHPLQELIIPEALRLKEVR